VKDFIEDVIRPNLEEFKKAYEACPDEGYFTFKGYAKYLIEYMEDENAT